MRLTCSVVLRARAGHGAHNSEPDIQDLCRLVQESDWRLAPLGRDDNLAVVGTLHTHNVKELGGRTLLTNLLVDRMRWWCQ